MRAACICLVSLIRGYMGIGTGKSIFSPLKKMLGTKFFKSSMKAVICFVCNGHLTLSSIAGFLAVLRMLRQKSLNTSPLYFQLSLLICVESMACVSSSVFPPPLLSCGVMQGTNSSHLEEIDVAYIMLHFN